MTSFCLASPSVGEPECFPSKGRTPAEGPLSRLLFNTALEVLANEMTRVRKEKAHKMERKTQN